jgi:hypothetical protein
LLLSLLLLLTMMMTMMLIVAAAVDAIQRFNFRDSCTKRITHILSTFKEFKESF